MKYLLLFILLFASVRVNAESYFNIGYRFQPRNGLQFRVGLSPKCPFCRGFGYVVTYGC